LSVTTLQEPDAGLVGRARALNVENIRLFKGHIDIDDRRLAPVDADGLNSGDLITILSDFTAESLADHKALARLIIGASKTKF